MHFWEKQNSQHLTSYRLASESPGTFFLTKVTISRRGGENGNRKDRKLKINVFFADYFDPTIIFNANFTADVFGRSPNFLYSIYT